MGPTLISLSICFLEKIYTACVNLAVFLHKNEQFWTKFGNFHPKTFNQAKDYGLAGRWQENTEHYSQKWSISLILPQSQHFRTKIGNFKPKMFIFDQYARCNKMLIFIIIHNFDDERRILYWSIFTTKEHKRRP